MLGGFVGVAIFIVLPGNLLWNLYRHQKNVYIVKVLKAYLNNAIIVKLNFYSSSYASNPLKSVYTHHVHNFANL